MARIIKIMSDVPNVIDEIYDQYRQADQLKDLEFSSAVTIQSWYRGVRVRSYYKHLTNSAVLIQKIWRAFRDRKKYRIILEDKVRNMRLQLYNERAVMIQKFWRGFYSRKYIFDYYKRRAYLNGVVQKNELILKELKEYKEYMVRNYEEKKLAEKFRKMEEEAKRNHYMISTKVIPGVYNSPFNPAPSEKEYLMRTIKLDPPKKPELYIKSHINSKFELIQLPEGLPELVKKPQGPFRDPLDVRKQRYRPFSPSLRVETDYESLEKARQQMKRQEWTERLHDEVFHPVHKSMKHKPYEKLLSTTSQFGALDYGTKCFRENVKEEDLPNGRFKSLVPPIPDFSKLNKTYVDAHYYLSSKQ